MAEMIYLKDIATLKIEAEKCTGCETCLAVCPHAIFGMNQGKAEILHLDRCMECGACAKNCAFGALTVTAGVGCASAIIYGWVTGKEPSCDCGGSC
jgi:NAD-dependent dihydropyrimidine dehydrogenase PreA subunit